MDVLYVITAKFLKGNGRDLFGSAVIAGKFLKGNGRDFFGRRGWDCF